jgi:hypothetical protein
LPAIVECLIAECCRNVYARMLCKLHYDRQTRYGRTHNIRAEKGTGKVFRKDGYIHITVNGKKVLEHVHLAEKALGRPLPSGVQVHHMNEIRWDNHTPLNLVICPDQSYHKLLHKRMQLLKVRS